MRRRSALHDVGLEGFHEIHNFAALCVRDAERLQRLIQDTPKDTPVGRRDAKVPLVE